MNVITRYRRYDYLGRLLEGSVFMARADASGAEVAELHRAKAASEPPLA